MDGKLVTFLSQKSDQDGLVSPVSTMYSSVLLPLEKIGQDFNGKLANLKVYNKALSLEEIANEDDGKVNVAQNTHAGSSSYKSGDAQDDAVQRTSVAMKAIDGDAFTVAASTAAQPDTNTSEIYSYWRGDHADSALTIDLGEKREISEIGIQWRYGGKGKDMQILTSMDGENWNLAKEVRGNADFFQTIVLDNATDARYVKWQGIASNASVYMIQEFMVYETVDKTALDEALSDEVLNPPPGNVGGYQLTEEEELALYNAVVYATALYNSPLATIEEVETAAAELNEILELVKEKPETSWNSVLSVFSDVKEGQWYVDAVQYVYDHGIMSGSGSLFKPNGNITREQVIATLYNMEGKPEVTDYKAVGALKDVKAGQWYTDAICWAYNTGVASGSNGKFNVGADVTRQQLAMMLYNYAAYKGYDTTANGDYSKLEGAKDVASYAVTAMKWAYGKGLISGSKTIVNGVTVYNLNPTGNATRAQMASILKSFCENIN